jgi:hypothetical protein
LNQVHYEDFHVMEVKIVSKDDLSVPPFRAMASANPDRADASKFRGRAASRMCLAFTKAFRAVLRPRQSAGGLAQSKTLRISV